MKRRTGILWVALGVLLILAGCARDGAVQAPPPPQGPPPQAPVDPYTGRPFPYPPKVSNAGRVVVEVLPLNLDQPEDTLHFQVAMNTHWVELDYDLSRLSVLRTSQGDQVLPLRWEGDIGGHHVAGVLYFPAVDLSEARWVEVEIRDVAGVPKRIFRWELKER